VVNKMAAVLRTKHCRIFNRRKLNELRILRQLSNKSSAIENDVVDDHLNGRDIPFLYLPHTAQKAYHVHWSTTSLPDNFDKYKWLTKTISTPELPTLYGNDALNSNLEALGSLNDSLRQAVAFQRTPKNRNVLRFYNERISYSLFTNFLRVPLVSANEAEHLKPENSQLYHKPKIETHWPRNYKFFHTEFEPSFVLRTKSGLDMVEEPQVLTPDQVESIPGPFHPYAMNLYKKDINHLRNRAGMDNSKFNPVKHCHTTIMINNRLHTDQQLLAGGTFTCFAQLLSQAFDNGNLFGTDLLTPLVTQCIITNGHKIAFLVFQLNTMNLLDDKGVWNRVWYTPSMDLYKKKENSYLFYETAETCDKDLLDNTVANNILQFIGRKTT